MKPKIIDNFLDEGEFSKIQEQIMGEHWSWFFNGYVEFPREDRLEYKGRFHFIHVLYGCGGWSRTTRFSANNRLRLPISPLRIYLEHS